MDINTAVMIPCKCPKCEISMVATVTRMGIIKYRIELSTSLSGKKAALIILDDLENPRAP